MNTTLQLQPSGAPTYLFFVCLSFLNSFEFVKAVGNSVTKLTLPSGQEASGRVIKHVAGQGPVYVRALRKIVLPDLKVEQLLQFYRGGMRKKQIVNLASLSCTIWQNSLHF